jgi:hypothetical protein
MRTKLRQAIAAAILALYILCASASTHVNDSGTWRTLTEIHVNDSGTWREIEEVWINDSGTWRLVFVNAVVALGADKVLLTDGSAGLAHLDNDGDWTSSCAVSCSSGTWSSTWVTPTSAAGSDYEARCTRNAGAAVACGSSDGSTWLSLGTSHTWSADPGTTFTLDIRRSGVTLDSVQVSVGSI